jgi:hypothetical protein
MIIPALADLINSAAGSAKIGDLQDLRVKLGLTSRRPSRQIFDSRTTHETYAFHVGGRTELQFNIGSETRDSGPVIRHGVAFSLELSQTLPSIQPLLPKVERFNDFVRNHPEEFPGFRMWHYDSEGFRGDYSVAPIPPELVVPGTFIMLGRWVPESEVDVDSIIADFDRLLPLYINVEAGRGGRTVALPVPFKPGCPRFVTTTTANVGEKTVDVALKHKALQTVLFECLVEEAGQNNVAVEQWIEYGVRVDTAVRSGNTRDFYERKIGPSAQACIRTALGQLLEYGHWPAKVRANRLVIVGEPELDEHAQSYLELLRSQYRLPVWYRQLNESSRSLTEFK